MIVDRYAEFIWPAYIVTAVLFVAMIGFSLNHARRWRRRFEELSGQRRADR